MATTFKYPLKQRLAERIGNRSFEKEGSIHSACAEDVFDNPSASLTGPPWAEPKGLRRARLPSVDEFDFEEACHARELAHRFGPRGRQGSPEHERWSSPAWQNEPHDARNVDWWVPSEDSVRPRVNRRGLFWGICASIVVSMPIMIGAPALIGVVQQFGERPPARASDVGSHASDAHGTNLSDRADPAADVQVAEIRANSVKTISIPAKPTETMSVSPLSPALAAAPERPTTARGGSGTLEQSDPPAAMSGQAFDLDATSSQSPATEGAAIELAEHLSEGPPTPTPDQGRADPQPTPAGRQPTNDSTKFESTATVIAEEPASAPAQHLGPVLSQEQIDRLLERGEESLQSGDITSARLLFLRVAAAGDRRGAKGVGMTFDPRIYLRLAVTGLTPDPKQAEIWYEKARGDLDLPERPSLATDTYGAINDTSEAQADTSEALAPGSPEWSDACASKYKTFEPSTGLFTAHSGAKRPCRLP